MCMSCRYFCFWFKSRNKTCLFRQPLSYYGQPWATKHIFLRVLQPKRLGLFDSNFARTFILVLLTWWKNRTFSFALSAKTAVPISMKMVFNSKATVHNLVRVLQHTRLSQFGSNFAHAFLWVLPTWWINRNFGIAPSAQMAVPISMKMVFNIESTVRYLVRVLQPTRLSQFGLHFAHTYLWVLPNWRE